LTPDEYNTLRRQLDDLDAKLASLRYAERERR
jgi:tetrahydromethanopterin S-methyltransferase subunit G